MVVIPCNSCTSGEYVEQPLLLLRCFKSCVMCTSPCHLWGNPSIIYTFTWLWLLIVGHQDRNANIKHHQLFIVPFWCSNLQEVNIRGTNFPNSILAVYCILSVKNIWYAPYVCTAWCFNQKQQCKSDHMFSHIGMTCAESVITHQLDMVYISNIFCTGILSTNRFKTNQGQERITGYVYIYK